ncbi:MULTISPECIES: hypothetical protein [Haloferacaceae]|uniref:Uncharacterized protein n=1 Tax=Halorubrum glutamatedens TaxID=2707018 RepID=A0ABD5QNC2_9EURY|nr:hypothetical protein [Halobellus captivus]
MRTIPDLRVWLILGFVLGCVPVASAANVTIEQGDTFGLPNSNTSITWGYEQTFNISQLAGYNDTLGIGERNISIYADDGGSVNVTVFDYNVSRPVTEAQDFLTFQVEPNDTADNVVFRINGFASIEAGSYRVDRGGTRVAQRYNGGVLSWTDGGWTRDNITVRYDREEEDEEDDAGGGGGSISVDPFCRGDAVVKNQHSWFTDKARFVMDGFDSRMGLDHIEISTERNVSGFELCVQRLDTVVVDPPSGGVYAYYHSSLAKTRTSVA